MCRTRVEVLVSVVSVFVLASALAAEPGVPTLLFEDDFEGDLSGWTLSGERGLAIVDTGDPDRGRALALDPHGDDVYALIEGSEAWHGVRIEGEMLFPPGGQAYLGWIYHFVAVGERVDFGLVYAKGNGSYLQANPHRDLNVSRTLYPELRASLDGAGALEVGRWQSFRLEILGPICHVYIGTVDEPQLTLQWHERELGALGLQPRSVGDPVWVDGVRVWAIDELSYQGPPRPTVEYHPEDLLTRWEVAGPFERTDDGLARGEGDAGAWRPLATDPRGAVETGRVVDTHGPRTVAYFRARVDAEAAGPATLELATVDDLALWVNGRFHWFVPRQRVAWHDFARNRDHAGVEIPVDLRAGRNDLVMRVRGGVYASGGFFARIVPSSSASD